MKSIVSTPSYSKKRLTSQVQKFLFGCEIFLLFAESLTNQENTEEKKKVRYKNWIGSNYLVMMKSIHERIFLKLF